MSYEFIEVRKGVSTDDIFYDASICAVRGSKVVIHAATYKWIRYIKHQFKSFDGGKVFRTEAQMKKINENVKFSTTDKVDRYKEKNDG